MSDLAFDPPPSPPPPSYEISQHEFDQKTSHILEQSAAEPQEPRFDEGGFQIWDETLFELNNLSLEQTSNPKAHHRASSSSMASPPPFSPTGTTTSSYPPEKSIARPSLQPTAGSGSGSGSGSSAGSGPSSSTPSSPPQQVRPLRVNKKTRPTKERPAWYAEAGLGGSPPPSPLESRGGSSSTREDHAPLRRQLTVFNASEREGTPPPEFTSIGPSLDGPPYETIVMSYDGGELPRGSSTNTPEPPAFSTPPPPSFTPQPQQPPATVPTEPPAFSAPSPSLNPPAFSSPQPPASPAPQARSVDHTRRHPAHAQSLPQNRPVSSSSPIPGPHALHHQSLPVPPSNYNRGAPRVSMYEPTDKLFQNSPRLLFNPQMAYSKPAVSTLPSRSEDLEPQHVNATSFYSHAVSAQYSFNVPSHMRKPTQPTHPVQPTQLGYSQQYPQTAAPPNGYGMAPDKAPSPPVISPRPDYGYSQATFQDNASVYSTDSGTWGGYAGQQGWPPNGGSHQTYR